MVRVFLFLSLSLYCVSALSITLEEIKELQYRAYELSNAKKERLNKIKLNKLKIEKREKEMVAPPIKKDAPINKATVQKNTGDFKSDKYSNPAKTQTNNKSHDSYGNYNNSMEKKNLSIGGSVAYEQVSIKRNLFGITRGSRIEGNITRAFSSAESSLVEIEVTKTFIGKKKPLSVGSLIWGIKSVNSDTRRIEILVQSGITPAPKSIEFDINGVVRDKFDVVGVSGIVKEKNKEILQGGLNTGLIAAGKTGLRAAIPGNIAGAAIAEGAGAMLDDKKNHLDSANNTNIIIYANPQPVTIIVGKTF